MTHASHLRHYMVIGAAAGALLAGCWLMRPLAPTDPPKSPYTYEPTLPNSLPTPSPAPEGMAWIPGGEFTMGSIDPTTCVCSGGSGKDSMHDARPLHRVYVDAFWMDRTEVTNEQFEQFVRATGYVTIAERKPRPEEFPGVAPEKLIAGSTVFTPPDHAIPLNDVSAWWRYQGGADWRHPEGPQSTITGKEKYPVVQIAYADAESFARWAGKRLPTEAEFEFAARGGLTGKLFAWGDEFRPAGKYMANTFQGEFPNRDASEDGYAGIAPVAQFPPNAYGLYDVAGNVWEWCSDWYRPDYYSQLAAAAKAARNPKGPDHPSTLTADREKVQKGGSFLCTDQYCTRYMVGTRGKAEISTGANHVGFRCVRDP